MDPLGNLHWHGSLDTGRNYQAILRVMFLSFDNEYQSMTYNYMIKFLVDDEKAHHVKNLI